MIDDKIKNLKYKEIIKFMKFKGFNLVSESNGLLKFKHINEIFYYSADIISQLNKLFNIHYTDIVISNDYLNIIKLEV